MLRGIYIAATGMLSDIARQDAIANNLANANTTGYKADEVVNSSFGQMMIENLKDGRQEGSISLGTQVAGVVADDRQGTLRATQQPLDLALSGDGFFSVQTSTGVRYTRDGTFNRSAQGYLVDSSGNNVLDTKGKPISLTTGKPTIQADGTIIDANGQPTDRIQVTTLDMKTASKQGSNLWTGIPTGNQPGTTSVRQGYLENSTVNSVTAMVDMVDVLRGYEANQKAITAIDGTLEKAVNSVGVVNG